MARLQTSLKSRLFQHIAVAFAGAFLGLAKCDRSHSFVELKRKIGDFQLAGGNSASMKEINGGRRCTDAFGKEPPGYFFSGKITLDDCAKIAMQQPAVLGFRWGSGSFHHEAYNGYANPEMVGKDESDAIDLHRLFGDAEIFTCGIFVKLVGFNRQPAPFHESNLTATLGIEDPRPSDGPAGMICFQRWTLVEFLKPHIQDLWFCYMASSAVHVCNHNRDIFYFQGEIFIGVFIMFLAMLGFIMRDLPEFEIPLVWFTRLLVNMELGLVCVAFFIKVTPGIGELNICILAYFTNIAMSYVLFVPYWVAEWCDEDSPFNTAYLLALSFSPAFLCEFMTYYPGFITLVSI